MKVAIIDANEQVNSEWKGIVSSIIGQWLDLECQDAGVEVVQDASSADLIFVCHTGAVGYAPAIRKALKAANVEPEAGRRGWRPYIVAGGPVDSTPHQALLSADAMTVGEAYESVRMILRVCASATGTAAEVDEMLEAYPHAITRRQIMQLPRDRLRPWLYAEVPPVLATPGRKIDWTVPPIKSGDGVTRILGSKGCHFKCGYCATTYRQVLSENPNPALVREQMERILADGGRVQVISNDPANLPWFLDLPANDSGSYTVEELLVPQNFAAVVRQKPKIVRFGVEGISQRIRWAWQKPIPNVDLLRILNTLAESGIDRHIFLIIGAPYESAEDYEAFKELFLQLASSKGRILRIKVTAFTAAAPAPLARFVTGDAVDTRWKAHYDWYMHNAASRYMMPVAPRQSKTRVNDLAEMLSLPLELASWLQGQATKSPDNTFDLAPDEESNARLLWNVVGWPTTPRQRFRFAETFRERMLPGRAIPAMATEPRVLRR